MPFRCLFDDLSMLIQCSLMLIPIYQINDVPILINDVINDDVSFLINDVMDDDNVSFLINAVTDDD